MVKGGKRGVSLVEEVCAVAVLSIVVIGLVFVIGFSQTSVVSYNAHDKAAARVQEVSDMVMAALAQCQDADGEDVLNATGSNIYVWPYNGSTPRYSADKTYYSYERILTNTSISGNDIIGYDINVIKYYNKTSYVGYNSYVTYTGKDV